MGRPACTHGGMGWTITGDSSPYFILSAFFLSRGQGYSCFVWREWQARHARSSPLCFWSPQAGRMIGMWIFGDLQPFFS